VFVFDGKTNQAHRSTLPAGRGCTDSFPRGRSAADDNVPRLGPEDESFDPYAISSGDTVGNIVGDVARKVASPCGAAWCDLYYHQTYKPKWKKFYDEARQKPGYSEARIPDELQETLQSFYRQKLSGVKLRKVNFDPADDYDADSFTDCKVIYVKDWDIWDAWMGVDGYYGRLRILAHELKHVDQCKADGGRKARACKLRLIDIQHFERQAHSHRASEIEAKAKALRVIEVLNHRAPWNHDADLDGITQGFGDDNCAFDYNPSQSNYDGAGEAEENAKAGVYSPTLGDACDPCITDERPG